MKFFERAREKHGQYHWEEKLQNFETYFVSEKNEEYSG
jgi:uncharacterized protein YegP (UPF0339 family)